MTESPGQKTYLCGEDMEENKMANLNDPEISYERLDDKGMRNIMVVARGGVGYTDFIKFANKSPFTLHEWSMYLHVSDRTLLRYQKEKRAFDVVQSEKILEIVMLYKLGVSVFGSDLKFNAWLETENLVFGSVKPKTMLDTNFGIQILKDELYRIEQGIFA